MQEVKEEVYEVQDVSSKELFASDAWYANKIRAEWDAMRVMLKQGVKAHKRSVYAEIDRKAKSIYRDSHSVQYRG